MAEELLYEVRDGVATVTLNGPISETRSTASCSRLWSRR